MEFATRRRLEASNARAKSDLMDCNRVGPEDHLGHQGYDDQMNNGDCDYGRGVTPYQDHLFSTPQDIDAFGKGKGKGTW